MGVGAADGAAGAGGGGGGVGIAQRDGSQRWRFRWRVFSSGKETTLISCNLRGEVRSIRREEMLEGNVLKLAKKTTYYREGHIRIFVIYRKQLLYKLLYN